MKIVICSVLIPVIGFHHGRVKCRRFGTKFRYKWQLNSKLRAEFGFGNVTENVKLIPRGVMHQSGVLPFGSSPCLPKQADFAATPDGESGTGNTINKSNRTDTKQKSTVCSRNRNWSADALKSVKSYSDQMKIQPWFY